MIPSFFKPRGQRDGPFANHSHTLTEVQNNLSGAFEHVQVKIDEFARACYGSSQARHFHAIERELWIVTQKFIPKADLLSEKEMSSRSNCGTSGDDAYTIP